MPLSTSTGDTVAIKDYTGTFGTNNVTVGRNSSNMNGSTVDYTANTNHLSLTLVYTDSTEGWVAVADNTSQIGTTFISVQVEQLQHQATLKFTHLHLQDVLLFHAFQMFLLVTKFLT